MSKQLPKITPYTKSARARAKRLIKEIKDRGIQIWKTADGFEVVTFEKVRCFDGESINSFRSVPFAAKASAFAHILKRAATTGNDLSRFELIAERFFRRFGVPA